MDQKAKTMEAMLGAIKPVEVAATIGPLLLSTADKDILYNEYKQILDILAPSFDIVWIQNIQNFTQLQVIMDIVKIYKDDEQIWINIDNELIQDGGHELFDFFLTHKPGSIIVIGNDCKEINRNLVLVKGFTEIEGMTKFGVIIDNKKVNKTNNSKNMMKTDNLSRDMNEIDKLWKQQVSESDDFNEWKDEILDKASKFWIEQGVAIIGCEWENGLKVVKKNADAWNATIGRY